MTTTQSTDKPDLSERLLKATYINEDTGVESLYASAEGICDEAAYEIRRLRAEVEGLKEQNADLEKAALKAYEDGVGQAFEAAQARATAAEAERDKLVADIFGMHVRVDTAEAALAAVTAERDAALSQVRAMREALTIACKWGIASVNFNACISVDLRDWFVAFVAGRKEPFPDDMLKTLSIIDPEMVAALTSAPAQQGAGEVGEALEEVKHTGLHWSVVQQTDSRFLASLARPGMGWAACGLSDSPAAALREALAKARAAGLTETEGGVG